MSHKNDFGHVLVIAGSSSMLGAAALVGLSAMRSGAGLTTVAVAKSLNKVLHEKLSPVIMTMPLPETTDGSIAPKAYTQLVKSFPKFDAVAMGPGMTRDPQTTKLILKVIAHCPLPMVIDGDGLNALAEDLTVLTKSSAPKVLTPHIGEMSRLTKMNSATIESSRSKIAKEFAEKFNCTLVLKGHQTIVAYHEGKSFVNPTGNAGMATAGSGDVLTGMIAAFLGQGLASFDAACLAVYLHGLAGDLAAKEKTKAGLIATDLIDFIPDALKTSGKKSA